MKTVKKINMSILCGINLFTMMYIGLVCAPEREKSPQVSDVFVCVDTTDLIFKTSCSIDISNVTTAAVALPDTPTNKPEPTLPLFLSLDTNGTYLSDTETEACVTPIASPDISTAMPTYLLAIEKIAGHFSIQGRRATMEDAHSEHTMPDNKIFLGVFDGHAGSAGAEHAANNLFQKFMIHLANGSALNEALTASFEETSNEIKQINNSGSTAVVAHIDFETNLIHVANAGDSRAIIATVDAHGKLSAIPLSNDHKPSQAAELERLCTGNFPTPFNDRLGGMIAVSRALGDRRFNFYGLIATPEILTHVISQNDQFIILTCDGVWERNILSIDEGIAIVHSALGRGCTAEQAAKSLVNEAYYRGSEDNISVTVLPLNQAL